MGTLGRRLGAAIVVASSALAAPSPALAECLGCEPAATSIVDSIGALSVFAVIIALAVVAAVVEARR